MEDINIKINRENRTVIANKYCIGNDGETLQGNIVFSFDEFVDGQARLEYVIKGAKAYQMLEKDGETYKIPIKKVLTKEGTIDMQLVITIGTDETETSVFKSNIFSMFCDRSINSEIEQPDEYLTWIEVANTKLNQMDNLDIDIVTVNNSVSVEITKKDGIKKSVVVNGVANVDLSILEKTLQDILTIIQGGELNENQVAQIEQLIVSYFESKTVEEVEK